MKRFFATLFCLLVFPVCALAAPPTPEELAPYFAFDNPRLDWAKEEWTGSDKPFLAATSEIEALIKRGRKRDDLVALYQKAAQKQPQNARAQFAYAHTLWRSVEGREKDVLRRMQLASEALSRPQSPRSYRYTRLRWLVERVGNINGSMQMTGLGKRLIGRQPNDFAVKLALTRDLLGSRIKTDITVEALRHAKQLAAQRPKDPNIYALLGDVYSSVSFEKRSVIYADKAIEAFKRYLASSPSGNYPQYRKFVLLNIRITQKMKRRFTQG